MHWKQTKKKKKSILNELKTTKELRCKYLRLCTGEPQTLQGWISQWAWVPGLTEEEERHGGRSGSNMVYGFRTQYRVPGDCVPEHTGFVFSCPYRQARHCDSQFLSLLLYILTSLGKRKMYSGTNFVSMDDHWSSTQRNLPPYLRVSISLTKMIPNPTHSRLLPTVSDSR